MAETSLSLDELLRKLMGDDHADVLRESLAWFVRELMEVEVATRIGAAAEPAVTVLATAFSARLRTWLQSSTIERPVS